MIFRQLFDTVSCTYTYVIARRPGGEAVIVDPVRDNVEDYLLLIERLGVRLVKAIDTHLHADHITGLGELRARTGCTAEMGEQTKAETVCLRIADGDIIDIDGLELHAIHTPGHTQDSYCFLVDGRLLTGDTLLIGGTGRTDFRDGDPVAQYNSLFNGILRLPEETLVYPGHDYRGRKVSTIGTERAFNPRLQVDSADEYAGIMNGLKLPNPRQMDVAVPTNHWLGMTDHGQRWRAATAA